MKDKYAIVLVRVSTDIQDYKPQIEDLIEFAKKKGFTKFKQIHTKESGLADLKDKKGLEELYEFIKNNSEYKTVFATELSRLARRQSILHEIKEWLIKNKIQLYLKDTGYSLYDENGKISAAGEIMFTLYGYFAESEIKVKKERFTRSKKYWMERGISISGKTLFGYERIDIEDDRTTLIKHPLDSETVIQIFNWYLYGIDSIILNPSIKTIALHCIKEGKPIYTHSKRNINKLLKEAAYTGEKITNNKRKNPNYTEDGNEEKYITTNNKIKYPQIINIEKFQAVQKKLKENNTRADKSTKHTTILSGLVKCHACGNNLTGDYRKINSIIKNTYRCSTRTKVLPCDNKQTIGMVLLDSTIWCLIKTDLKILAKSINKLNPNIDYSSLKKQKERLEENIALIDKKSEEQLRLIKVYKKLKNIDTGKHNIDTELQLIKLDKEKGKLNKELSNIDMLLSVKQKQINNIHHVIESNLKEIENSSELLKKYINYFVENVEILLHNSNFTALKVNFKIYSELEVHSIAKGKRIIEDGEFTKSTYVILDKTTTLNIRAVKSIKPLKFKPNSTFQIGSKYFKLDSLFDNYLEFNKKYIQEADGIRLLKIQKLSVY